MSLVIPFLSFVVTFRSCYSLRFVNCISIFFSCFSFVWQILWQWIALKCFCCSFFNWLLTSSIPSTPFNLNANRINCFDEMFDHCKCKRKEVDLVGTWWNLLSCHWTHVIVFFSWGFDSGRARFSTFKNSFVLARIRECMYAFEHWNIKYANWHWIEWLSCMWWSIYLNMIM